jgi:NAD+ kinase
LKFALVVRTGREETASFAGRLTSLIEESGASVVSLTDAPDVVVAVGGDGTMLAGVHTALELDVPVIGFNLGTMGFLTEADPDSAADVVKRLVASDFNIVERMTVSATVGDVTVSGVNDVVVEKVDSQRLVELSVVIDGSPFVTYRSDGVIVATPTGSTAYSFSAGGPLVDHDLDALILSPVAAHSLFDRSIVLAGDSEIEVVVNRDRSVHVTVDKTDMGHLAAGRSVVVRRGERPARFVSLGGPEFAGLVKAKFRLD